MTLVVLLYKEVRMPIPAALSTAMIKCVRVHKEDGAFTPAELVYAGYEEGIVDKRRAFTHPVTGDCFTFQKLAGIAVMSKEDVEKAQAAKSALKASVKAGKAPKLSPAQMKKVEDKAKKAKAAAEKSARKRK